MKKIIPFLIFAVCLSADASVWTIQQITNNSFDDNHPRISGTNVVWHGWDGSDFEIYQKFGNNTITKVTDNNTDDRLPSISGSNIAWRQQISGVAQIVSLIDGVTTQESNASHSQSSLEISGTNIVWWGFDGNDNEIYSNFSGQITNNNTNDWHPDISGTNMVWSGDNNGIFSIYNDFGNGTETLTSSSFSLDQPAIDGTNVVWHEDDGNDFEIFSNFAGQITFNTRDDTFPMVNGNNVVWKGLGAVSNLDEIFSNFGGQITNNLNSDSDPAIDGNSVVWHGWDGNDWEIYQATFSAVVPEPSTGVPFGFNPGLGLSLLFSVGIGEVRRRRKIKGTTS